MSDQNSESVDLDGVEDIELPPAIVKFLRDLEGDQKRLMKKDFPANADAIRKFLALHLVERMAQMTKMFGITLLDMHQLAVSNATQLQRQRKWTAEHLRKLGVEVSDGEAFAGIGTEQIDAFGQALYALGSHLQAKYPNDKEVEQRFNTLAQRFSELVETLMGDQSVDDGDGEEEDEEASDDDSDGSDAAEDSEASEADSASPTDGSES